MAAPAPAALLRFHHRALLTALPQAPICPPPALQVVGLLPGLLNLPLNLHSPSYPGQVSCLQAGGRRQRAQQAQQAQQAQLAVQLVLLLGGQLRASCDAAPAQGAGGM